MPEVIKFDYFYGEESEQKSHFDTSGFFSIGNQEVPKKDGSNIDLNKTEKNYTDLSIIRPGKAGAGFPSLERKKILPTFLSKKRTLSRFPEWTPV